MEAIVAGLWNISIQAAIIFLVLFAVRCLFSLCRAPKKYAYALWVILFVRLLLPVQLESAFGLMPQGSSLLEAMISRGDAVFGTGQEDQAGDVGAGLYNDAGLQSETEFYNGDKLYGKKAKKSTEEGQGFQTAEAGDLAENLYESESENVAVALRQMPEERLDLRFLSGIWLAGIAALLFYGAVSYVHLRRKVQCSIRLNLKKRFASEKMEDADRWRRAENIYLADEIDTPFVMGLVTPKIYLPSAMEEKNLPYVIIHEQIHIRRRDYLFKMAAFLITCFYWFHPFVWLGFLLMSRDMEMSCDEAVMKELGEERRADYAESLLLLSCGKGRLAGAPLAFSEGNARARIKHIMKYKRPIAAVAVFAGIFIVVLAAGLLTSPKKNPDMENPETGNEAGLIAQSEVKITELENKSPEISMDAILGADGPILDYADGDVVIFHGYFGLFIYSETKGGIIGSVDLQAIGCSATQGDNYCEVFTATDGFKVYLHPLGNDESCTRIDNDGNVEYGIQDFGYVYDVESGQLSLMEYSLFGRNDETTSVLFRSQVEEELFDIGQFEITGQYFECRNELGRGVQSYHCAVLKEDGAEKYIYLESVDGTIGSLVYAEKKLMGDGTTENKIVRLFGENPSGSSTATYGCSTEITIDGITYDIAERNFSINAITGIQYADGFWIVEGHINPNVGSYSLYDTQNNSWETDIFGSCLTWESLEGAAPGDSIRETAIYALNSEIYNFKGDLLAWVNLEQGEYVKELFRDGNTVFIQVQTVTEECRELMFSYPESLNGHV